MLISIQIESLELVLNEDVCPKNVNIEHWKVSVAGDDDVSDLELRVFAPGHLHAGFELLDHVETPVLEPFNVTIVCHRVFHHHNESIWDWLEPDRSEMFVHVLVSKYLPIYKNHQFVGTLF